MNFTTEELKAKLRKGDFIDMWVTNELLAKAISKEAGEISVSEVNAAWEAVLEIDDLKYVASTPEGSLFGLPLIFRRYMDFSGLLGEHLGKGHNAVIGDLWVTDDMPITKSIFCAVMDVATDYLAEVSIKITEQTGISPRDVYIQARKTGETLTQSSKRLSFEKSGLRLVRENLPEP